MPPSPALLVTSHQNAGPCLNLAGRRISQTTHGESRTGQPRILDVRWSRGQVSCSYSLTMTPETSNCKRRNATTPLSTPLATLLGATLALSLGGEAGVQAAVLQIGTQSAFSASGTIVQNTNWDSFGPGFFYPGSPYTVGDLTFVEGSRNLIGGAGTFYNLARNLLRRLWKTKPICVKMAV